jgi:hypothetical protein
VSRASSISLEFPCGERNTEREGWKMAWRAQSAARGGRGLGHFVTFAPFFMAKHTFSTILTLQKYRVAVTGMIEQCTASEFQGQIICPLPPTSQPLGVPNQCSKSLRCEGHYLSGVSPWGPNVGPSAQNRAFQPLSSCSHSAG